MELPTVALEPFDESEDVSAWFEDADWAGGPDAYDTYATDTTGAPYLVRLEGEPVAFVHTTNPKYDDWGGSTATLVVAPARRGQGIGAATLRALTTQVPHLANERIVGKIYVANGSSIRCAERAGYTVSTRGEDAPEDGGAWVVVQSRPRRG